MSATGSVTALMAPVRGRRRDGTGSWAAFCLLALYGTLRWGTMLEPHSQGRLYLALILAILNALALRRLPRRGNRDWLIPVVCLLDVALVLLIAGFPFAWVLGGHWGRLGSALSDGVSTIPGVLVPYTGSDPNTAAVIVLGAAALLLCGGLAFGNVRGTPASGQLLLAALPLLALAIVPSAIVAPKLAFFHGLLTFTLVALLVLSPRLSAQRRGGGAALLASAAILGAVAAGVVAGSGRPWLRVATGHALAKAGSGGGGGPAVFNWAQTYGPLGPTAGIAVMSVAAKTPAYWKSEDLDAFNGRGWTLGDTGAPGLLDVSTSHRKRYSEELSVNITDMESDQVIAAGYAHMPFLSSGVVQGNDAGTWLATSPMIPGTSYTVEVYVPTPSLGALSRTGRDYPAQLGPFTRLTLPTGAYSGVETLAHRLAAGQRTPIGYVEAVMNYLQNPSVFSYTLRPPRGGRYPLVSFLLHSHRGYCQQFAGAMALLLRMGGVPARVAVGFSTGRHQAGGDSYVVYGKDAHAWVEAWFPTYGWVTFDPTPAQASPAATHTSVSTVPSAPAAGHVSTPAGATTSPRTKASLNAGRLHGLNDGGGALSATSGGGVPVLAILGAIVGLGALLFLARLLLIYARRPTTAELTDELERAFTICGDPLGVDVTLTAIGARLTDSPTAAAYVHALAASRYERDGARPTRRGRAALRRRLAAGLGPVGLARTLRALPPRRAPR